jgi:nucleoside-diphosphate-sugar epimerase
VIGCGYLGRRAAALWAARGDTVSALTRGRATELAAAGLHPILGDVLDPASLRGLPAADTILYAVGYDPRAGHKRHDVYVTGLEHALTALPPGGRFIYVSSTGVYGQQDGSLVDETSPTEPADESGRVILEAEGVARRHRPDAVVLRFAGIYGPGRLLREASLRAGEPLVMDADKWLNLIHVDDGAAIVVAVADAVAPAPLYNVADDEPVPRRDFYTRLAAEIGAPAPVFAPPPPGVPTGRHDAANRRVSNRRLRQGVGVTLRYPTYREGLAACHGD